MYNWFVSLEARWLYGIEAIGLAQKALIQNGYIPELSGSFERLYEYVMCIMLNVEKYINDLLINALLRFQIDTLQ